MVIISFDTDDLKRCCCEYAVAEAAYGPLNARALFTAIADAEAMTTAEEWIEFSGPEVEILESCSLMLSFGTDLSARLIPVGTHFEREDDGSVKWQTVQRLKVVHIERQK